MSEQTPTLASLIAEAIEDVENTDPEVATRMGRDGVISQAAYAVVPSMTTTLFAMVVADNSLAFLDCDGQPIDPFSALSEAIGQAVLDGVEEHFATLEDDR